MTNKFNILYEEIMNKINNYSEVHTTILKVYNWNIKDNDFTDLDKEILNFKFKEGGKAESEILEDLTYDFCYNFEVPADTKNTCSKRANNSVNFEDYVRNGCQ